MILYVYYVNCFLNYIYDFYEACNDFHLLLLFSYFVNTEKYWMILDHKMVFVMGWM